MLSVRGDLQVCGMDEGENMASLLGLLIKEVEWVRNWEENEVTFEYIELEMPDYLLYPIGRWVWSSAVTRVEILIYQSLAQMEIEAWKK